MPLKIGAFKNFGNFTRKTPVLEFLFKKVAGPQPEISKEYLSQNF